VNRKKTQQLYRDEGLSVRKRRARKKATGTRAPLLTVDAPNARWSVGFVHNQFASGWRFQIFNVSTLSRRNAWPPWSTPRSRAAVLYGS
jgi:putative transposase